MPVTKTRRMVTAGGLEWRSDSDGVTLEGHASTFNQPYNMGWYTETVAPGAFTRTLKAKPDVRLLINHEGLPLGRTTSGTLDLAQDDSGLYMRSVLNPADPDVQRIIPKLQRGDLNEMSFSFGAVKDKWSADYSERTLRELSLADGDVSVVTYPANPNATVSMRTRILESVDPDRLREIYAEVMEGRSDVSGDVLESLAVADDESSLAALSALLGVADGERSGESGPEIVTLPVGATVTPLHPTADEIRATREVAAARIRLELMRH